MSSVSQKFMEVILGYPEILEFPQNGYYCSLTQAMTHSPHNSLWCPLVTL